MTRVPGIAILAACVVGLPGCNNEDPLLGTGARHAGSIVRLAPSIDALIPADAVVEKIASDFQFTEGPVWIPGQPGKIYFSDIPADVVYRWSQSEGLEEFLRPVSLEGLNAGGIGGSNGLARDPNGRLVLCEHGNRRIARVEPDGRRITLADRFDGRRLNSPNDIVFHSTGAAFFTDPPYGLPGQDASAAKEQPHNGIYRLDSGGKVTLLIADQTRPNGIGLSPDEQILYVANSDVSPHRLWMSYPVLEDLTLGDGSVFFDASEMEQAGVPDGLVVDRSGNLFAAGIGGVMVLNADGKHLGTIALTELPTNVGWGDDGHSLYMTAHTGLYRIKLNSFGFVDHDR